MRLLKLMVYSILGFVIYELVQGMRGGDFEGAGSGSRGGPRGNRGQQEETGGLNLTGPGEGTDVEVADVSGTTHRQTVGRGVVH
jgi:hypothetical protein